MNYGPLIFLASFFALALSWFGMVLTPHLQVGHLDQTNTIISKVSYPLARPGLAREGLDVYRANGCACCHSQQASQTGTMCDVVATEAGTNLPAAVAAVMQAATNAEPPLNYSETEAKGILAKLPETIVKGVPRERANMAMKALKAAGVKYDLLIVPVGPDIERGWAKRRTLAEDFLFDYPVMPGSQRIGPDLSNIALRNPDPNWHLRHLYAPRSLVPDSAMPPYRFLFEQRRIERALSPDALQFTSGPPPPPGYEIVPKQEAKALVAYLVSLRGDADLYEAPLTPPAPPPAASTNAAATNASAK